MATSTDVPWRAPERARDRPARRGPGLLVILLAAAVPVLLLAVVVLAGGSVLVGHASRASELRASLDAYVGGDCATAVRRFDAGSAGLLLGDPPAPSQRQRTAVADCRRLLAIGGGDADRLRGYAKLAGPMSRTPSRAALAGQVSAALASAAALAKKPARTTCDALYALRGAAVLPEQDAGLSRLLLACGTVFGASKRPEDAFAAMQLYRDVRTALPRQAAYADAVEAESQLRLKRVKDSGIWDAEAYAPNRKGSGKRSTIVVGNDTPTTVYLAVVGRSDHRMIELKPCTDCKVQKKSADYDCRTSTPHVEITLPKGTYSVAWELEQPGSHYRLFGGRWDLGSGGRYRDCTYIVG